MRPELTSVEELTDRIRRGLAGNDVETDRVSVGFLTQQGARHHSRRTSYRNHVLSLRVGEAVGSCAVEPGEVTEEVVLDCVGASVQELLRHRDSAVRVAALDAYLMRKNPHREHATEVVIDGGDSLRKSSQRAKAVVDLLPAVPGQRVFVLGVVNSLLRQLRERGERYVPCDYKGGQTEWGEPVVTDWKSTLDGCDAVLASGMVLGNGTFAPLLKHVRSTGKPLVLFAQTASAVLPWFLESGVTAVSAEPYPFFWLDGGASVLYRYPAAPYWFRAPTEESYVCGRTFVDRAH